MLLLEPWTVHGLMAYAKKRWEGVAFRFLFPAYYSLGLWKWHPVGVLRAFQTILSRNCALVRPPKAYPAADWWSEPDAGELRLVDRVAENKAWDIVMCYLANCTPALDLFGSDVKKVVLPMDAFHLSKDPTFAGMTYERERGLLSKADVVVAINQKEARIFQEMLPEKRIICARTAMPPMFSDRNTVSGRLLFVASSYAPNLEGIGWFLSHVAPLLEKLAPGHFTLHVAGNCCIHIQKNDSGLSVNLLGRVENLEKEYEEAESVITPLLSGTGVSAKAVEAVAHGKALVATSVGARGLEEFFGEAILIGDSPEDFAKRLIEISFSSSRRYQVESCVKSAALNELSPEKSYAKLVEALRC